MLREEVFCAFKDIFQAFDLLVVPGVMYDAGVTTLPLDTMTAFDLDMFTVGDSRMPPRTALCLFTSWLAELSFDADTPATKQRHSRMGAFIIDDRGVSHVEGIPPLDEQALDEFNKHAQTPKCFI
jgi:hypothetical protein